MSKILKYNQNQNQDHLYGKIIDYFIDKNLKESKIINVSLRDESVESDENLLIMSKDLSLKNCTTHNILCPIWCIMELKNILKLVSKDFCNKIPKAIWRGSTTGPDNYYMCCAQQKNSRLEVVRLSKEYPNIINASFTNIVQYVKSRPEKFKITCSPQMDITKQIDYKYIIVADGNVATYGLFWALSSGSVVLKQDSEHIQYIQDESICIHEIIKPWIHYVPIKRDFSDLVEKINYLLQNENKAIEISKNSREYSLKYFNESILKQQLNKSVEAL